MVTDSKNNWTSIYLFYKHDLSLLLVKLVLHLINQWTQRKLITNYFFIRYWEKGQHIRLRIKADNRLSEENIRDYIMQIYEQEFPETEHYDEGFNVVFQPYEPEIDRYGGKEAIKLAERFFEHHSRICLRVLTEYRHKWNYNLALSFDMQMLTIFLKVSGNGIGNCIRFFDFLLSLSAIFSIKETKIKDPEKEIMKELTLFDNLYSEQKSAINFICEEIWNQPDWEKTDWRFHWAQNCREIIEGFQILNSQDLIKIPYTIEELKTSEEIHLKENIEWLIWQSYFHMINNRMGIFSRDESFIYFALLEGFENLENTNIDHIK